MSYHLVLSKRNQNFLLMFYHSKWWHPIYHQCFFRVITPLRKPTFICIFLALQLKAAERRLEEVENCECTRGCDFNGSHYHDGQTWSPDLCTSCTCSVSCLTYFTFILLLYIPADSGGSNTTLLTPPPPPIPPNNLRPTGPDLGNLSKIQESPPA